MTFTPQDVQRAFDVNDLEVVGGKNLTALLNNLGVADTTALHDVIYERLEFKGEPDADVMAAYLDGIAMALQMSRAPTES